MTKIFEGTTADFDARFDHLVCRAVSAMTPSTKQPVLIDSSKEVSALKKLVAYQNKDGKPVESVSVIIIVRDPRNWLVSDEVNEKIRGSARNLRIRLRRLRKWQQRYERLLAFCTETSLPTVIVRLDDLQRAPTETIGAILHGIGLGEPVIPPVSLDKSTTHIVWGSHHRFGNQSNKKVFSQNKKIGSIIWLLPWLLSPHVRKKWRELSSLSINIIAR